MPKRADYSCPDCLVKGGDHKDWCPMPAYLERARQRREEAALRKLEAPVYTEGGKDWPMHDLNCPCRICEHERKAALKAFARFRGTDIPLAVMGFE